mmetsp:Transcript_82345/g.191212  ORF Transcript_82345/g.191212 Transcript_82345/m.191212 type:complete len:225 (+) Transcript_82345:752-1426(+)
MAMAAKPSLLEARCGRVAAAAVRTSPRASARQATSAVTAAWSPGWASAHADAKAALRMSAIGSCKAAVALATAPASPFLETMASAESAQLRMPTSALSVRSSRRSSPGVTSSGSAASAALRMLALVSARPALSALIERSQPLPAVAASSLKALHRACTSPSSKRARSSFSSCCFAAACTSRLWSISLAIFDSRKSEAGPMSGFTRSTLAVSEATFTTLYCPLGL